MGTRRSSREDARTRLGVIEQEIGVILRAFPELRHQGVRLRRARRPDAASGAARQGHLPQPRRVRRLQ